MAPLALFKKNKIKNHALAAVNKSKSSRTALLHCSTQRDFYVFIIQGRNKLIVNGMLSEGQPVFQVFILRNLMRDIKVWIKQVWKQRLVIQLHRGMVLFAGEMLLLSHRWDKAGVVAFRMHVKFKKSRFAGLIAWRRLWWKPLREGLSRRFLHSLHTKCNLFRAANLMDSSPAFAHRFSRTSFDIKIHPPTSTKFHTLPSGYSVNATTKQEEVGV